MLDSDLLLATVSARNDWLTLLKRELWAKMLLFGVILLAAALIYVPAVLASKLDPVFIYYTLLALSLALILGALVEHRLQEILRTVERSSECCKKSDSRETASAPPETPPASLEVERMKIQIAADYTNTVYTNMIFFLLASLVAVVVALGAPLLARPDLNSYLYYFAIPTLLGEAAILSIIINEFRRYRRRLRFVDSLIAKIERIPPQQLGPLDDLLLALRRA